MTSLTLTVSKDSHKKPRKLAQKRHFPWFLALDFLFLIFYETDTDNVIAALKFCDQLINF